MFFFFLFFSLGYRHSDADAVPLSRRLRYDNNRSLKRLSRIVNAKILYFRIQFRFLRNEDVLEDDANFRPSWRLS